MLKPENKLPKDTTMFAIIRALLARFKGKWGEVGPELRLLLYVEIGFYCVLAFVVLIWQPEFL